MVYKEHPVFEKPEDENIRIWRYMDFTKLVSLIEKQALFFARADMLPDPFEGSSSKANIKLRPVVYKEKIPPKILKSFSIFLKDSRKFTIINSWHMNEHESAAMWKIYLKTEEGVAIQSTFKRLTRSLKNEYDVFVGKVKYIDYEKEWLPEGNIFYPYLRKRKSFEHERELRAIIQKIPVTGGKLDLKKEIFETGAYISVDLNILIEKIFVSPTAPKWFDELIKAIVRKYNLAKEVVKSNLANGPVY